MGAIVFAACGGSSPSSVETTGSTTTSPTTTASSLVDQTVVAADPLEALLISSVPVAFTRVDDNEAGTGPSDLAKAVSDDGRSDAEAVLTEAGFMGGYQRAWQTDDQSTFVVVFLYQFSSPEGAVAYGDRAIKAFDTDTTLTSKAFEVADIPDAKGRSLINLNTGGGLAASISFTKDGYLVQLNVIGPTDDANQTLAQQLAADQFSRL